MGVILKLVSEWLENQSLFNTQIVMCLVSTSKIGSTHIALLVFGKDISATVLYYIINSKENLLHSESKVQIIHSTLLIS